MWGIPYPCTFLTIPLETVPALACRDVVNHRKGVTDG